MFTDVVNITIQELGKATKNPMAVSQLATRVYPYMPTKSAGLLGYLDPAWREVPLKPRTHNFVC